MDEIECKLIERVWREMDSKYNAVSKTKSFKKNLTIPVSSKQMIRWIDDLKLACASKTTNDKTPTEPETGGFTTGEFLQSKHEATQ